MRLAHLSGHPLFHKGVYFILVHFDTNNVHDSDKSKTEVTGVHPEIITLGTLRNTGNGGVTFSGKSRRDVILGFALGPVFNGLGFGTYFGFIHTHGFKESGHNILGNVLFGVVLQQQIQGRQNTKRPNTVSLESCIDSNQMGGSHNIGDHILVKSIDGMSKLFSELCEGFAHSLDLFASQMSETLCEFRIGSTGFVCGLILNSLGKTLIITFSHHVHGNIARKGSTCGGSSEGICVGGKSQCNKGGVSNKHLLLVQ
mmetsp:Transcript_2373/g.3481  ORF Transcript_2373/g.3481 Transcript_2373/m.3481 type:complete len:256 (-) Transcript_2373:59-826(-)